MGTPRVYSPTPLFLMQKKNHNINETNSFFSDFAQPGIGTPLFNKGRSCIAYLLSIFKSLEPSKNEILIPAYNAQSLAFAAIYNQLQIKLIDITPEYFFPSSENYLNAITDKTLAVILPYNWGVFPEIKELQVIFTELKKKNIFWIDDFASSYPQGEYLTFFKKNSPLYFFSFGKTKILSLIDGGYAFIPQSSDYYGRLSKLIEDSKREREIIGKSKFDILKTLENLAYHIYTNPMGYSILSMLGVANKDRPPKTEKIEIRLLSIGWENVLRDIIDKHLWESIAMRLMVNKKYHQLLSDNSNLFLFQSTEKNAGSRFPLLFHSNKMRDEAKKRLNGKMIGVSTGHDKWLKEVSLLKPYLNNIADRNYPEAINFQNKFLTLPSHNKVSDETINLICDILNKL